jgi:hypothetical membrane protein
MQGRRVLRTWQGVMTGRAVAVAGVVGPVVFVTTWATLGATRPGYSPVDDAISQLAKVGTSTRPAMTVGFLVFGVAVCAYAAGAQLPRWSRASLAGTALAIVGVAAFPLGGTSDTVHAVFAGIGYATLAAAPLTASRVFAQRWWSVLAGVTCALLLAGSVAGPAHGLLQRAGLTVGDAWIVATAVLNPRRARSRTRRR